MTGSVVVYNAQAKRRRRSAADGYRSLVASAVRTTPRVLAFQAGTLVLVPLRLRLDVCLRLASQRKVRRHPPRRFGPASIPSSAPATERPGCPSTRNAATRRCNSRAWNSRVGEVWMGHARNP